MVVALVLAATACGSGSGPTGVTSGADGSTGSFHPDQRYEAVVPVLEDRTHGPMLCPGGLMSMSLPPQCGSIPVAGFSWDDVEGEESASGTTWGGPYRLVGTFDGDSLTLTDPPAVPEQRPSPPSAGTLRTPCDPEPGGRWVVDGSRAAGEEFAAMKRAAEADPQFAGLWVDYSTKPPDSVNDNTTGVVNVRFTGDLARHERELRDLWGGPLCLAEVAHTEALLTRAQDALFGDEARAAGIAAWRGGVDIGRNVVSATVTVADDHVRRWIEERFGAGVVDLDPVLRPL